MNSLKTVVMIAFLAAVAYVVYVSITKNPRQSGDMGASSAWPDTPKAELLGPGGQKPTAEPKSTSPTGFGSLPFGMGSKPSPAPVSTPDPVAASVPATGTLPSDPHVIAPPNRDAMRTAPLASTAATGTPAGVGAGMTPPLPSSAAMPPTVPTAVPRPVDAPPTGYTAAPVEGPIGSAMTAPRALDAAMLAQFNGFLASVRAKLDDGKLDEGLLALSQLYGMPEIPPEQGREITDLLSRVSGTVIYSRGHYLAPAYRVQQGETLQQIAQKYNVPPELLQRINGIGDPAALKPGQELKVVQGPFDAQVSLGRYELVLRLQGRYAGRFPIGIGRDNPQLEGRYIVRDKVPGPVYAGPDGLTVSGNDPSNPLGPYAIDLGGGIAIHGTNNLKAIGRNDNRGYVCLGERDIEDVFTILSIGSKVEISR